MVDVEHGALRALEHHAATLGQNAVEQAAGIGNQGPDTLSRRGIIVVHLRGIERIGAEERVRDGILFFAGRLNVRLEQRGIQQVHDAQSATRHLVFKAGPMPLLVVPIFWRPGAVSAASSIMRW